MSRMTAPIDVLIPIRRRNLGVVAELPGVGLGHGDILPVCPLQRGKRTRM
jgi:hypothetical protein